MAERKDYETPVTDVIKSVNETSKDFIIDGMGAFDRYTGVDQITSSNSKTGCAPVAED